MSSLFAAYTLNTSFKPSHHTAAEARAHKLSINAKGMAVKDQGLRGFTRSLKMMERMSSLDVAVQFLLNGMDILHFLVHCL